MERPANTAVTYRIPRNPTIPSTKTLTGLGATGRMVNGVSMFDSRDAFSYKTSSGQDATPTNGLTGDGIWNRDGYHNEGPTWAPNGRVLMFFRESQGASGGPRLFSIDLTGYNERQVKTPAFHVITSGLSGWVDRLGK